MGEPFFKPYFGKNYSKSRTLILSESAYSWKDKDTGKLCDPPSSHPKKSLLYAIKQFPQRGYFASMSRALCGIENPNISELTQAWDDYAYTIYVQGTVGCGARKRPTSKQWKDASDNFLRFIENERPRKVIVTGMDMWNHHMSETHIQNCDHQQAYRLKEGSLVWCLALPHPSNSRIGFNWQKVAEQIRQFRSAKLRYR